MDVRLLSACKSLVDLVAAGSFREDLFCISVIELRVPSLRERRRIFPNWPDTSCCAWRRGVGDEASVQLTAEAIGKLGDYGFPGSVRELETCWSAR